MTAELSITNKRTRRLLLLVIPAWLVAALLVPLTVLVFPLVCIVCLAVRINPLEALGFLWRVIAALRGTHIEMESRDRSILIEVA